MDETLSFEDVMIQLRLTSEELHRLVQSGELKAQTDATGAMRFRASDVEAYRARTKPQSITDVIVIPPKSEPPRERGAVAGPPPPPEKRAPSRKKPPAKKAKKAAPKKAKKGTPRKKKR